MAGFTTIAIIYNPKATGDGKRLGQALLAKLQACLPNQTFQLLATEHIGHAEELAYNLAKQSARPLVISASGDGGYHEVVNGLLRAQAEGARPTAGLLPAGNANDHYRNARSGDIVAAICGHQTRRIDILTLHTTVDGQPYKRFAHSYIGFGMNAELAERLSDIPHTFWSEFKAGIGIIWKLHKTRIKMNGAEETTFGAICSNVPSMAKHFTVGPEAKVDDGKFEVNEFRSRGRLGLYRQVFIAAGRGFQHPLSVKRYQFTALEPVLAQLDGEVITIDAGAAVRVDIMPGSLRCII